MKALITAVRTKGPGTNGGFFFGEGKCLPERWRLIVITDTVVAALSPLVSGKSLLLDRELWTPRFEERFVATWFVDAQNSKKEKTSKSFRSVSRIDEAVVEEARACARQLVAEGWERVTHTPWTNPKWYPDSFCLPLDGIGRPVNDRLAGEIIGAAYGRLAKNMPEDFIRWNDVDGMLGVQRWLQRMIRPDADVAHLQQSELKVGKDRYPLRAEGDVIDVSSAGVVMRQRGTEVRFRCPDGWEPCVGFGYVDGALFRPNSRRARAEHVRRRQDLSDLEFQQECDICHENMLVQRGTESCPSCGRSIIPALPMYEVVLDKQAFLIELPEFVMEDNRIPLLGIQDPRTLSRCAELEKSWEGQPWKRQLDRTVRRQAREALIARAAQPARFKNLQMILG